MDNIILAIVLAIILGSAIFYIIKAKKSGAKCIGCAMSKSCSGNCQSQKSKEPYCSGNCSSCSKCNK